MISDKLVSIIAIIAVTFLEGMAIYKGIDGTYFVPSIVLISGLGGYHIGKQNQNK